MTCNIYRKVSYVGFSKKEIENIVKKVMVFLKKKKFEISVHLVSDKKIREINAGYRGNDRVTDVIAFALQEGQQIGGEDFGDIFISVPQVKRQAKEQKISYKEEFTRMLVHSVLHLNGFDHINKQDREKMFKLQEKIVKKIVYGF